MSGSDPDGDALAFAIVSPPLHGTLSGAAPTLTYTPFADYNGVDGFAFAASDGLATSNVATISLTVRPVNDAPLAAADSATALRKQEVIVDVLANDTDVDADPLTLVGVSTPSNGNATIGPSGISYSPRPSFTGTDQFTYTIADGKGGIATGV